MGIMTTREAAQVIGVGPEAVRKMLKTGRLEKVGAAGRTILIDADSVHRVHRDGRRSGRLWTQRTAWAALALISGAEAPWLSASELWRLRKRIESLSAEEVHQLSRNRASLQRYRGGDTAKRKLSSSVLVTGVGALKDLSMADTFGLASGTEYVEGYVRRGFIDDCAHRLGLREDPSGDILMRTVDFVQVLHSGQVPVAAIAVDLMDSAATRERSAGRSKLEELLSDF